MFAKSIIDSDAFLDMPTSSQALYFHLAMRADDDGFINNPKRIQRTVGVSEDDMKILIAKGYLLPFETGVVVVRHWRVHNYIQKDRYKETQYLAEKSRLTEQKDHSYVLYTDRVHDGYNIEEDQKELCESGKNEPAKADVLNVESDCIQNGYMVDTHLSEASHCPDQEEADNPLKNGKSLTPTDAEKPHENAENQELEPECIQNGYIMDTQVRLGKLRDSVGKNREDKDRGMGEGEETNPPEPVLTWEEQKKKCDAFLRSIGIGV